MTKKMLIDATHAEETPAISIAPFTLGLLQYALEVDAGTAGEPEEVVLNDRVLQGLGLVWLVVISVAVFF